MVAVRCTTVRFRQVGSGSVVFNLEAYAQSREAMTAEFEQLMPCMVTMVGDWLRMHDRTRVHKAALTAKSYFLQEAEGLSRQAKVAWAALRGDAQVTNLQHDGVVVLLPDCMSADSVLAGMSDACAAVLGYAQPVEEKALGEGVAESEDEAEATDGEADAGEGA